jgi:hypothetical protein
MTLAIVRRFNGVRACSAIAGWLILSFHTRSYSSTLPQGTAADEALYGKHGTR